MNADGLSVVRLYIIIVQPLEGNPIRETRSFYWIYVPPLGARSDFIEQ